MSVVFIQYFSRKKIPKIILIMNHKIIGSLRCFNLYLLVHDSDFQMKKNSVFIEKDANYLLTDTINIKMLNIEP